MIRVDAATAPEELRNGLSEIIAEYAERFADTAEAVPVTFRHTSEITPGGFTVHWGKDGVSVHYVRVVDAFRALGRLLGIEESEPGIGRHTETAKFDMLGMMVDVSRNGVLKPDAVKMLLRRCALMGINVLMLYAEDTYEVAGEPFFGYLRGRYTHNEMRDLDRYADNFGIEIFPCIQTLGHMEQVLKWPAYADYRDTPGILLAEDEPTYRLIEKMIAAASGPFRSKRIHIGMDEAIGIGLGEYRKRHGNKKAFDILNAHLERVIGICRQHDLRPMIWSDMYFRLGSRTGEYYDRDCVIPEDIAKGIPKDVGLVYWDYYHTDRDFYTEWIDRHRTLGSEPIMASGLWTWNHLWAGLPFAFTVTDACMQACKQAGLREVFTTLWGDDGMECDIFSALPALQRFAEHGYVDTIDEQSVKANFRGSCNADFDDWVKASELDSIPNLPDPAQCNESFSKWLLWQDMLLGLMEPRIGGLSLREHYHNLSETLFEAVGNSRASLRLLFPAQVAKVLSYKCELRRNLVTAYLAQDRAAIRRIMSGDLQSLRQATQKLWKCHREMWLATYKPFGWEVIEQRYGGLLARLEGLADRLEQYLEGRIHSIPEFETRLERVFHDPLGQLANLHHSRIVTASVIR